MKRIILFVPLLLLIYVNTWAGNNKGKTNTAALVADFSASVTSGCAPLTTSFADASTFNTGDPIVSWNWDFGDGNTGTGKTPSHTYNTVGSFTVSLTITTQSSATQTQTKTAYIKTYIKYTPDLGPDVTMCAPGGPGYMLNPNVPGSDNYIWSDPSFNGNPTAFVQYSGVYWVDVINGTCVTRDSIAVSILPSLSADFSYTVLNTCGNVQVQFTNLSASCDGGTLTYDWYFGDNAGGYSSDKDPLYTFTDHTSGVYTYTVALYTYKNGGDPEFSIQDITIDYGTPPSPVNMGADKNICAGNSVQLDAGYELGATYVWSPATGLSNAAIYNPVASPSSNQTYTVTKTKCGSDVTGSINVIVNPPFTVNLGPDQGFCAGGLVTLNSGVTGATSITWGSSNPVNPTFDASFANQSTAFTNQAGTYFVDVVKNNCRAKDTVIVTSTPAVKAGFTHAQTASCGPYTVNFTDASVINCGTRKSYTWDFGDGAGPITYTSPGSSQRNPVHNYTLTGNYTVLLTVTNSNDISDTYTQTISVTGSGLIVNLGNDTTICTGNSITLDAGNAGATYLWSTGAVTKTITVNTGGTYSVTVTNGGCNATDAIDVTVSATPPAVNLGNDTTICTGNSITLNAGNAGATYLWSTGATTQSITVNTSGTYSVTVTKGTCTGTDAINVTVSSTPLTVNLGNDTTICTGNSIVLNAGNTGAGFLWSTGATTQTITVGTTGTYSVTVTNGGCTASDAINVTVSATPPSVNLGNDTTLCLGSSITLDAGNTGATYLWSTGATTKTITVNTSGTYSVNVTNGTCSGNDAIVVTVNPSAFVVNLGPDTAMCGGLIQINSGVTGASGITWGSSNPVNPGFNFSYTNQATAFADQPGTYFIDVIKNGCEAKDTLVIATKKAVKAKFTAAQTTPCSPYAVKFTDATVISCGTRKSYTWDFGDGAGPTTYNSPGSSQRSPTHNYIAGGTYTVTLIVATNSNGSDTTTLPVTVTGSGIAVNLGKDTTICSGTSLVLNAGNNPGANFAWNTGATSQTISVTTAGTYYVAVSNGICTVSDTITVAVSPSLTVNLGSDTTICTGNSVILDAGHAGSTYLWSTGETTQTISVNTKDIYTVAVTNGSCSGTGSRNIDVISSIPVSLGNDTTICSGNTVILNAGYPGATYTWSNGSTSQIITTGTAGTYSVTVNKNGCTGQDDIQLATVVAPTTVDIGNDTTLCFGNSVTLDAGNPGSSYLWSTGATTQTITVNASGFYSVSVSGCSITVPSNVINISLGNLSMPAITQSGIELICTDADTYQWYKDGRIIPGATGKKYKPRGYGKYSVVVTSTTNGCTAESAVYFFVPNGDTYLGDIRIVVSPNPGNGQAKLIFSKLPPAPIKVTVYDRIGRRILFATMANTVNDLNLTPYAKGEYFVECILNDKRVIIPVVTQ